VKNFDNREEYRKLVDTQLKQWHTCYKDTELLISAQEDLSEMAYGIVLDMRKTLDDFIEEHEEFGKALKPYDPGFDAPLVVKDMCSAALAAGVGPMAAVAGAFAKEVGSRLLKSSKEVVIENGGDVWLKKKGLTTVAIYAGMSPLSMKMGITVDAYDPIAVCTSSGTVGPSLSFGKADAAVAVSYDACLADACATRLGNEIKKKEDIETALQTIYEIKGVVGAFAVVGDVCGGIGDIELVSLQQ